ncbi:hypothetical protein DSOUD_1854 [Desulfuromonas soudanensis]|uniref:TRASH domain-containing protein n=1 Tax=Desulfuromonas soudanensis TaxID=1603606 RepID=A0A0M4D2Q4_9BACT|nr:YHS domain-containing protein [Desulfuromonas soudanensis]ALC16626.1 hypothetical protein DSOUD_1854 [Desulfuromonas soudanensis]
MTEIGDFSEKIAGRLTRQRVENIQKKGSLNEEMQELIKQREAFRVEARRVLTSVVLPRIRAVAHHFNNAVVEESLGEDFRCACHFGHTARFPATVTLTVSIMPGDRYENLVLHHTLEILPEFIDYERHCDHRISPGSRSDDTAGRWVEEKMLRFLDTYLQLETHPIYQKENLVTDPVCGMRLPLAEAAGSIQREGREIFFCSQACRDTYLKEG